MRYATQEGSGRSKLNKRRSILFTSRDSQNSERKSETLPKRVPMVKCQSIQNVNAVSSRSLGRTSGVSVIQSASLSDLNVDRLEGEVRDHEIQPIKKSSRTSDHSHRFFNAIKRYLSLKSSGVNHCQPGIKRQSGGGQDGTKATIWSPRQVQPTGNGVFRPNSARGSTLILISGLDSVIVYGQRIQLEIIFPDYPIEPLRSFSSVFIDSKLTYSPDDSASADGDGYSSSSFNSASSLPKRSNSASSNSTASIGQSDLLSRLFHQQMQPQGFVITVQSYWRNSDTLEIHHQWLLHKKLNAKQSGSGRRRSSQSPGMTSSVSTTTLSNPVGRRASVLQRLFNKSELTLHTDV